MADKHGPLLSLRLGTELMVVGSSPATAREILKSHDRLLSARHILAITKIRKTSDEVSMFWQSECGDQWKFLRTLRRAELFSTKAIDAQSSIREKKVEEMVRFIGASEGQVVKVSEIVFTTIFNILAHIFFSKDFIDLGSEEGDAGGIKACFRNMTELAASPNIADFCPFLARYDLQGLGKRALEFAGKVTAKWEFLVQERRKENGCDQVIKQGDFLDVLIDNKFTNDQISSFALELLGGGTDTSTSTIEWAMVELIKNPEAMYEVQKELKAEIENCEVIRERNLTKLPYLNACIKETLRLHPPAPLLIPHRASETCQLMNYTIPKDTQIYVNVWAIGRDPKVWKDPLVFNPERFLNKNLDYKGKDFELLPFGAGRRMCPGLPMASRQLHLILASLLATAGRFQMAKAQRNWT